MSDYANDLLEKVKSQYGQAIKNDKVVLGLLDKIKTASDYKLVYKYAVALGDHLSTALEDVFSPLNAEGQADVWYGTAMQVLEPSMKSVYDDVAKQCVVVQNNINLKDGVRLKPQVPKLDSFNIRDLARQLADAETLDSIKQNMNHFSQKVVDDSICANAEFSNSAGYEIVITRTYDDVGLHGDGDMCDFCAKREGTKTFTSWGDAKGDEIFQRHAGCECTIEYSRSGGTRNIVKNYKRKK